MSSLLTQLPYLSTELLDMSTAEKRDSADGIIDPEKVEQEFVESYVEEFSPEDEKKLVRKLDLRIMSVASVLYLFACEFFVFCWI